MPHRGRAGDKVGRRTGNRRHTPHGVFRRLMCLILIAHHADPRYRLVLAANRDEYFQRPTAAADYWSDAPHVLGGRDLEQGGTWLGVATDGRSAAVTNFRDGTSPRRVARSGEVPSPTMVWLS